MEGEALQVTMRALICTALALSVVLAEATSSPPSSPRDTESGAVDFEDRVDRPSTTAAKVEYCNRRYAAKHLSSRRCQTGFYHSMVADMSDRQLVPQNGRDIITIHSEQTTSSAILRAEVEALIAFKEGVTADSKGALSSWNSTDLSACHWIGVTCDTPSKRVLALELGNLELVGSISPLLGRLQYLHNLDLSGNMFSGEIPVSLHNCSNLSHLALRDNNLTGQIPSELGDLLNLQYLDVSGNFNMGGSFPASLGNCSQLRILCLNFTNVEGAIPDTLGRLTHLEILNMSGTALSGAVPGALGNCSNLTQLLMGYRYQLPGLYSFDDIHTMVGLSGELPMEMGSLRQLNFLEIEGSDIAGKFPGWIANLTLLTHLTLKYSSFGGDVPDVFGKLPLEVFDVDANNFTGSFPTSLLNCSNLAYLSVSTNSFEGAIPPEIGILKQLTYLSMGVTGFFGTIPSSIANCSSLMLLELGVYPTMETQTFPSWITALVNLNVLVLIEMNLTGTIPVDIGKLSKLQSLSLAFLGLTGPIPASIGNCSLLQILELSYNQLIGEVPSDVWSLSQLNNFQVSGNLLTGTLPASIGNLSQILLFECAYNAFHGGIPTEIGSLQFLSELTMAANSFSGLIPSSLGNTSATALDLSRNYLIGSIPTSMGNLTGLTIMDLFENILEGLIPVDLMRCTQLNTLDLSTNSLYGDIPNDIDKLQSLQVLNLYYNNLSGMVPELLRNCINLLNVDLSYNSISGVLPPGIMTQLSSTLNLWDVSHNRLSGSLPQDLGQLTIITGLYFSANNFSGSIPPGLGECKSLITLDLSVNNLSGSIPQTLGQLKHLTFFNVSDNNLEGPIPDGGFFTTNNATPASFSGNDRLCGSILGKACADAPSNSRANTSTCEGFHCASIQIAVGCGAAGLLLVVLLVIWWFLFRRGNSEGMEGEEIVTSFERGLKMTVEDLASIMTRPENVIAAGAKSIVYKGMLPGCDKIVAIKTLSIRDDHSNNEYKKFEADLLREAQVMSKLRHRNILKVLGCFRSQKAVALISEFMPRASLYDQLYPSSDDGSGTCELNWDDRLHIAVGVAHGLVYLHNQFHEPIIHRDLKPSNIFLDEALEPKLGDFGIAKFVNPERDGEKTASTLCGTVGYIPPEYGTTTTVSTKGDVYSFGVVLLELLTRRHPIHAEGSESEKSIHLVEWVLESFEEQPISVLDISLIYPESNESAINKENKIEQMMLLMRVALLCTREEPHNRPNMTDVLGMLNQTREIGSNRVGLSSVTEMSQQIMIWNSPEDPITEEAKFS